MDGGCGCIVEKFDAASGVRDVFDRKVADFEIASMCAFLCDSDVSSCEADLIGLVLVLLFFGDAKREAEHEAGGVDFEEPTRLNEYESLVVVTLLRFLLGWKVELFGSADDTSSVGKLARVR